MDQGLNFKKHTIATKTFSRFIEGDCNRLALAMAMAVSENPGGSYNPLYIYGGRGTGKSHILHAIGNNLEESGFNIALCSLEENGKLKYHDAASSQIIICNNIDSSSLKYTGWADDFINKGSQLILSGNLSPEELPDSPLKKLILNKGKSADLQPPEEELRIAILKTRASEDKISLPDDAAYFVASHLKGNIRTLLGGYERVKAISALSGQAITRFSAIQALKNYVWGDEVDKRG